jgi:[acyl-carrier-protein] S-malonyltransferase
MIAWIFPGQGSQFIGMASGLRSAAASDVFAAAERVLGWDVAVATRDRSDEWLRNTEVAQPAIFTVSVAAARSLEARGPFPSVVAGHSVGEFAALATARAISFEDGLRAVVERGEAMAAAGREHDGGMAAVIGLPLAEVERTCEAFAPDVVVANVNAPGQVVISGARAALDGCSSAMRAAGARTVIPLPVSVAAHSPLMRPARATLSNALTRATFRDPDVPFVSGLSGLVHVGASELPGLLAGAVTGRVRWTDCVATIAGIGARHLVEIAPGRVLSGLVRHIDRTMRVDQAGTDEEIDAFCDRFEGVR